MAPPTTTEPSGTWWVPGKGAIEWQWELDHALSVSSATDMGSNDKTYTGATAPDPSVYDIDGIDNPASTVSALHALGDKVVCYIETGDVGNYYSASEEGIATSYYTQFSAAGDLGSKQSGYPEYYLNINAPSTLAVIEAMIKQQCSAKGFDAVETDNDETWQYSTGFSISEANDEAYMTSVANYIHSLGMAWVIKNCDDVGDTSFCNAMYPLADAAISEQCNQYGTCSDLGKFLGSKAIFNAEYTDGGNNQSTTVTPADTAFCSSDNTDGINGELFDVDLDGQVRVPCS
ncbi:MAG: endo alpha-1,4 polygalactosaminidase [Acidimicrobiales bacterium]